MGFRSVPPLYAKTFEILHARACACMPMSACLFWVIGKCLIQFISAKHFHNISSLSNFFTFMLKYESFFILVTIVNFELDYEGQVLKYLSTESLARIFSCFCQHLSPHFSWSIHGWWVPNDLHLDHRSPLQYSGVQCIPGRYSLDDLLFYWPHEQIYSLIRTLCELLCWYSK